jgi:general secretion pathway protein G
VTLHYIQLDGESKVIARLRSALAAPLVVRGRGTSGEAGMTLIEIIIVVALIGGLSAMMLGGLTAGARSAKESEARLAFGQLKSSLQMYKVQNGKFPTTEQGLQALVTNPGDAPSWRGPYCEEGMLNDPWGTPIGYESDGRSLRFISAGDDGQIGTDDDVTWPEATDKKAAVL